jgi:hypothetical protein
MQGARGEYDRVTGKWVATLGRCGKGRRDVERKADWLWEIGPKDSREYRKGFLIFRNYVLNKIRLNSNEFYSKPNSRSHVNKKIK